MANKIKIKSQNNGEVLRLTLNTPKANVLDKEMMTELTQAIADTGTKPEVKAIVFDAEGPHFSFGASVAEHKKEQVAEMLVVFHDLMRALIQCEKPTLAVVRGQCLGGALELVSLCHWLFAADDAMFGQPEINLAVFPPVASLVLPHRIGQSAADDLNLTGRSISAAEARSCGLVHSISENPGEQAEAFLTDHILAKSAVALKFATRASRFEMNRALLENIDTIENMYVHELMACHDPNEGIAAFLEKRKPVWKNN